MLRWQECARVELWLLMAAAIPTIPNCMGQTQGSLDSTRSHQPNSPSTSVHSFDCVPLDACTSVFGPNELPPRTPTCGYTGPLMGTWQQVICFPHDGPANSCEEEGERFRRICPTWISTTTITSTTNPCDHLVNSRSDLGCAQIQESGSCDSTFWRSLCEYTCANCPVGLSPTSAPTNHPSVSPTEINAATSICYTKTCSSECTDPCGWDNISGTCTPYDVTSDLERQLAMGDCASKSPTGSPTTTTSPSQVVSMTTAIGRTTDVVTTSPTPSPSTSTSTTFTSTTTVLDPCTVLATQVNSSAFRDVCRSDERCSYLFDYESGEQTCRQKTCHDIGSDSVLCMNNTITASDCEYDEQYLACHPAGEPLLCSLIFDEMSCDSYENYGASCVYIGYQCWDNTTDIPCGAFFDPESCPLQRCNFVDIGGWGQCTEITTTAQPTTTPYQTCGAINESGICNSVVHLDCIFSVLEDRCTERTCGDIMSARDCIEDQALACEYVEEFDICNEAGQEVPCAVHSAMDTCRNYTQCVFVGNACYEQSEELPCATIGFDIDLCPLERCEIQFGFCMSRQAPTSPPTRSPSVTPTRSPSVTPTGVPTRAPSTFSTSSVTTTSPVQHTSTRRSTTLILSTSTADLSTSLTTSTMTLTESTLSSTTSDLGARSSRTFLLISSESLNSVLVENATFLNRMAEGLAAAVNSDYRTFFRLQPHQFEIDEILYEARAVRITVTAVDPVSVEIALLRVIDERGLRVDPFNAAREGSTIELDVTTNAPQDGGDESPATLTVQEDKDEKLSRDVVIGLIIFATCVVVIAAFALSSWNRDSRRSPPHAEHDFSVGPPMVANKSFRYDTQSQGHLPNLVSSSSLMQLQLNPYLAQNGRVDTSI